MQALLELLPLVAFIVAYKAGGIYAATGALMAAMVVLLAGRLGADPAHSAAAWHQRRAGVRFRTLTLLLHDERFIQWKPTVFFWAVGIAFLASQWLGAKPLAQRLMSAAVGESLGRIARADWLKLNLAWVAFYLAHGRARTWPWSSTTTRTPG